MCPYRARIIVRIQSNSILACPGINPNDTWPINLSLGQQVHTASDLLSQGWLRILSESQLRLLKRGDVGSGEFKGHRFIIPHEGNTLSIEIHRDRSFLRIFRQSDQTPGQLN
jgi:hypothetical protein